MTSQVEASRTEGEIVQRAKKGLRVYFSILLVTVAIMSTVLYINPNPLFITFGYMFTPAVSAILTRIILKEGFKDVSFKLDRKVWKFIGLAFVIVTVMWLVIHSIASFFGLSEFQIPQGGGIAKSIVYSILGQYQLTPLNFPIILVVASILSSLVTLIPVMGEELGWRGFMLTRLIDAKVKYPVLMSGLIWLLWHAPILILNIGGAAKMAVGVILSGLLTAFLVGHFRLSSGSIWPAAIAHASNSFALAIPLRTSETVNLMPLIQFPILAITVILLYRTIKLPKPLWQNHTR
ncbi:CAAX protease self-immunity [Marininema mesophilum]|uniref:CAAX protease self-immunity n=1 Tax=Marininema mesophilum TaxID=1048340 RepID=A0A1H2UUL1_9BACL|nr:CPBP family intramembrane glutamic endopeptidase [Marininema mesophilum]SDW59817.1 CAAX protease self-immunity [Marininema mesophilum]